MTTTKKGLLRLLGMAFFTQAVTSFIGGAVFFNPFVEENIAATMNNLAVNMGSVYVGVVLQIVTAIVIIVLGVLLYQVAGQINKTMATIALSFYIFEALLLAIGQIFVFGLVAASNLFSTSGDPTLLSIGTILFACKDFAENINMMPFGLGAILFYYLIMKAKAIPKWLAIWGIVTVSVILVGAPLMSFGIPIPFALFIPYVPWEFFTGLFILIKSLSNKSLA